METQEELNKSLIKAARKGNAELVKELLANGADPKAKGRHERNALMLSSVRGHLDCVNALLPVSDVKDIDNEGKSALIWASMARHGDCIRAIEGFLLMEKEAKEIAKAIACQGAKETTKTTSLRV